MAIVNSWLMYRKHAAALSIPKKEIVPLASFKLHLAFSLTKSGKCNYEQLRDFLVLLCKRKLQYITSSIDKDQVLRETFDCKATAMLSVMMKSLHKGPSLMISVELTLTVPRCSIVWQIFY
ncbi:hypothetical protein FHG87_014231 [Trinorchestia longiramus]|nr:hypothetical protein FHG87_014231 [Trinorchestia longiramus]